MVVRSGFGYSDCSQLMMFSQMISHRMPRKYATEKIISTICRIWYECTMLMTVMVGYGTSMLFFMLFSTCFW